jgi:hypothetical protein
MHNPSPEDLRLIQIRLEQIYHSQRAIGELAIDALESQRLEACSIAISEMARANVKGLLACIEQLTGSAILGDHREEFDKF